jgi:hypothetical protein
MCIVQLATEEKLTKLSILTASFSNIHQIRKPVLHRESNFKNYIFEKANFKILKTIGEP